MLRLRRLLNLAVADTGGAHTHSFTRALDKGMHRLEIQIPTPLGDIVGVTDFMPELRPTTADFTNFCHRNTLPLSRM